MSTTTKKPDAERRFSLRQRQREGSFTLIETVIALAIVTFLIIEVAAVQGNSIVFSEYGRSVTQASWLSRRIMAEVEYNYRTKPFKDLITSNVVDAKFDDFDDYTYSLEIKEWKFPFVKMLSNALGGGSKDSKDSNKVGAGADAAAGSGGDDKSGTLAKQSKAGGDSGGDSGVSSTIETVIKQVFGDEPIFLVAHVEVAWAEGAQKNQTSMTYLMTNQAKLDDALVALKPVYDKLTKPTTPANGKGGKGTTPPPGTPGATPPPGTPGATPPPGTPPDQSGGDGSTPQTPPGGPPLAPPPAGGDPGGADGGGAQ